METLNRSELKQMKEKFHEKREIAKFLLPEQWDLLDEYIDVIVALRGGPLTAKQIQNYYINPKKDQPYSLKSTYRLIKKLERADIVIKVGEITDEKFPEYIYDRTATIFFPEPESNAIERWDAGKGRDYTDTLALILGEILEGTPDLERFYSVFREFAIKQHNLVAELIDRTKQNKALARHYSSAPIDQINEMHQYATMLIVLLKNPKYYETFRQIFGTSKSQL